MTLTMAVALVVCLLLPGLGWARKMRFGDRGDTLALAVVLSMCGTVAVGTAMALSGRWSLGWGLVVLLGIAAAGFVPAGALADRAGAAVRRRTAGFGDDGGEWADWYAHNQQQAVRRRQQAEVETAAASQVWVDWYQRTQLLTPRRDEEGLDR